MPWKARTAMEERVRFIARLLEEEGMSDVCRSFGISRKTGYKIFKRHQDEGVEALNDRSRRPVRYANQLPDPVERMIVTAKREKRTGRAPPPNGYRMPMRMRRKPVEPRGVTF